MSDMEKITHLNQMVNGHYQNKGICGQQTNCGVYQFNIVPPAVHHCITREINKVSCAECADAYAEQTKTPEQHNLDTAFKIIATKDKEIARLERENEKLEERTTIFEDEISRLAKVGEKRYKENKQLTSELTKSSNQVFGLNVQNAQFQGETRRLRDENIRLSREFREHKMSIMNRLQEIVQEQY